MATPNTLCRWAFQAKQEIVARAELVRAIGPFCRNEKGRLVVRSCLDASSELSARLTELPDIQEVRGDLVVGSQECDQTMALRSLPDDLVVKGNLLLHNCPDLSALPGGLVVEGNMVLKKCGAVEVFPMDFQVKGNVTLTDFETLPSALSFWANASRDEIDSVGENEYPNDVKNLMKSLAIEQQSTLLKFLNQVMSSRTMGHPTSRQGMAKRLLGLLQTHLMETRQNALFVCLAAINQIAHTDPMKAIKALNQLVLLELSENVPRNNECMKALGRAETVLSFAEEHTGLVLCHDWMDAATVYLMFDECHRMLDEFFTVEVKETESVVANCLIILERYLMKAVPKLPSTSADPRAGMWFAWHSFDARDRKLAALKQDMETKRDELVARTHQLETRLNAQLAAQKEDLAALKATFQQLSTKTERETLGGGKSLKSDPLNVDELFPPIPEPDTATSPIRKPSHRSNMWDELTKKLRRVTPAEVIQQNLTSYVDAATDAAEKARRIKLVRLLDGRCSLREGRIAVKGHLDLGKDLRGLQELPDLCRIEGDLWVNRSMSPKAGLRALPKGLHVAGSLELRGCSALTALPEGLYVEGFFFLAGCSALVSLPEGIEVGGSLSLYGWKELTCLPAWLMKDGICDLRWCNGLELNQCSALTALPDGFHVNGSLDLSGCTALTVLPEDLHVEENLDLHNCPARLPTRYTVCGKILRY